MRPSSWIFLFGILLVLGACQSDVRKDVPNVSHLKPEVKTIRFEQELFAIDTNNVVSQLQALEVKYPAFFDLYFTYIVPLKNQAPAIPASAKEEKPIGEFYDQVGDFLKAPAIRKLKDTIDIVFGDFRQMEEQFYEGFQYYKHHFPERNIPNIYTLLSEYAFQKFVFEDSNKKDGLGIGLDFFLGSNYPYQELNPSNSAFSTYLTRSFNKDHLVKRGFEAIIDDMADRPKGNRLLDLMIHNGKQLYILDQLIPYTPDTIKLEYTPTQVKWIKENEYNIWAYLIDKELLYSTNMREIQKLVNPSPHSPGMPPEAPGRTANWVGWQIVKNYMKRNPNTSLSTLLALEDSQKILDKAKYKPRR